MRMQEQFAREKSAITLAVHNKVDKVDSPMKQKAPMEAMGMLLSPSKTPSTPSRNPFMDINGHTSSSSSSSSSSSLTYDANNKLLEQLNMLRSEQRKLQETFAEER